MTCRMAAGQRRKQLTNSNHHELYKGRKKKRLESSDYILHLRSQIDLEWDVSQKRVIAKKEQVGVSWTDMAPFVGSARKSHSGVADVFSVPHDIFDLHNLSEVLTYEVWATCLSESERELLLQFLPSGIDTKQAVSSLLKGENHHFGNPCLKWSSLLRNGNLHPDVVLRAEQQFRSNKRAYYHEMNKYHDGMIEVLKKWKARWLSCKDPEKLWSEGFTESKKGKLTVSAEKPKAPNLSKREMSSSAVICDSDVVKYMSYIKVTRSQLQMLKNLKHSGDGIHPKSLSHVLGDINSFHVHPYETLEEEEKKKLHEHWKEVARKDVLAAYKEYLRRKLLKEKCWKSLEQDLAEKRKQLMDQDEETENSDGSSEVSSYSGDFDQHEHVSDVEDEKNDLMQAASDHHIGHIPSYSPDGKTDEMLVNEEAVEDDTLKQEVDLLPMSESLYNQNDNIMMEGSLSSIKDMWQPTSLPGSNYHSSQGLNYSSADQPSLRDKQVNNRHPAHMLDLERDFRESESGEPVGSAFNRTSLSPFANENHNEMLRTFPKESGLLSSYAHEDVNSLQQPALRHSTMANESLSGSGQFAGQFQGQPQLLQQREVWEKGPYMDQTVHQSVYSVGRYPSKGHHFSQADRQGFSAIQASEISSAVGYNWFSAENPAYCNWSGVETLSSRHGLGDGVNDGNLSSVFTNRLTSPQFDTTASEQYVQMRNFVGGVMHDAENAYSYAQTQLGSSSNDGSSAAPSLSNGSWMNFPSQNPEHHHSTGGRSFLRSWNL